MQEEEEEEEEEAVLMERGGGGGREGGREGREREKGGVEGPGRKIEALERHEATKRHSVDNAGASRQRELLQR